MRVLIVKGVDFEVTVESGGNPMLKGGLTWAVDDVPEEQVSVPVEEPTPAPVVGPLETALDELAEAVG